LREVTGDSNTILWYYLFVLAHKTKFAFLRCGRLLGDMNGKRGLKIKWKYFAAVSFDK